MTSPLRTGRHTAAALIACLALVGCGSSGSTPSHAAIVIAVASHLRQRRPTPDSTPPQTDRFRRGVPRADARADVACDRTRDRWRRSGPQRWHSGPRWLCSSTTTPPRDPRRDLTRPHWSTRHRPTAARPATCSSSRGLRPRRSAPSAAGVRSSSAGPPSTGPDSPTMAATT